MSRCPRQATIAITRSGAAFPGLGSHYSDFDYKVINYMAKLSCLDDVKEYVSAAKTIRSAFNGAK